jgi:hypothetical protein
LAGASLCHAKNLTQAQLEESVGSDATVLPAELQGFVSWSARSRTKTKAPIKPDDFEPEAGQAADVREIDSHKRPVWMAGVLLIGGALVLTGFVWRYVNDAARPMSDALSKSSLTEVAIPPAPSGASAVDQAEGRSEQGPVTGTGDSAVVPQETAAIPQTPDASNRSEETSGPNEQAANPPGQESVNSQASQAVPLVSAEPAPVAVTDLSASERSVPLSVEEGIVTYRYGTHGTVPDSAPAAPDSSATVAPAIESQQSAAPDVPAEAAITDTPSAPATEPPAQPLEPSSPAVAPPVSVAEAPAQQLELGTPAAPSLSDAATPPAPNSVLPSGQKAAQLPQDVDSVPLPVRKPVSETSVAINPEAEISPKPGRDSVAHPDRTRLAKGPSSPRSRSRVCVPILGRHFEGQCSN